jgi:hypothetical protein
MELGGSICAACSHTVHRPDNLTFSDRKDSEQRVGPLTPNGAFSPRCCPANLISVPPGGDSARFADQSAIREGGNPVAVPSGSGAKSAHASSLPMARHAQRLGARALCEVRAEGRPDHTCMGLHSEVQHVWSSRLHTCVGFGRRQSNNAKKHVYAVGHKVRPKSPALAHQVYRHGVM